jgi:MFS family permease
MFSRGYAITAAGSGLALLAMGLAPSYVVALLTSFAAGATQATFMAISLTYVQELSDEAHRGRVSSVYNFFAGGTMAFLSWGFGGLASVTSPALILLAAGVAFTLFVGVAALGHAAFRQLCSSAMALSLARDGVIAVSPQP